jgi:Peptidase family M28
MSRAPVWTVLLGVVLLTHGIAAADTTPKERTDQTLQDALAQVSPNRMMADVAALSSARFGGRQAGTAEDQGSAALISEQFTSSGLSLPAMNDVHATDASIGVMTSPIRVPSIDGNPLLSIGPMSATRPRRMPTDFMPVLDSPSADIHAPIVFVGYGMPDDYAGLDVHECLVLFLRGKPDHHSQPFSHAEKVQLAKAHGAAGYLTAVGPILKSYETRRGVTGSPSAFYAQLAAADAIPGAWISTRVAEEIIAPSGTDSTGRLPKIQELLNRLPASQSLRTEQYGVLRWKTRVTDGVLTNVLARLPGTGPETIIIGAHRDHFGHTAGMVFPGSDDNASGTAVLL